MSYPTFYPIKSKTVNVKSIQILHYVFCKENTGDFFLEDIDFYQSKIQNEIKFKNSLFIEFQKLEYSENLN